MVAFLPKQVQYIAPLKANFDLSTANNSKVLTKATEEGITVQWKNLRLESHPELGPFTFQVTVASNGDIVFVYESIPELIDWPSLLKEDDGEEAYVVGISDAFVYGQELHEYRVGRIDVGGDKAGTPSTSVVKV